MAFPLVSAIVITLIVPLALMIPVVIAASIPVVCQARGPAAKGQNDCHQARREPGRCGSRAAVALITDLFSHTHSSFGCSGRWRVQPMVDKPRDSKCDVSTEFSMTLPPRIKHSCTPTDLIYDA
jgi:hypothetical protein